MEPRPPSTSPENGGEPRLKIYFLPNLLTAGNMFCGFLALTKIVEADPGSPTFNDAIRVSLYLILLACIFDLFDGRVARMGGRESPFGREFDSLADVISFGVAPAFLVHRILLKGIFENYPQVGWFIASIYVICGAFRLARFNCLAAMAGTGGGKEFLGFPIPAAAGLVASITYFMLWMGDRDFATGAWRFVLPGIMVFLSLMMVSEVKYPTFKSLDFRAKRTFSKMVIIVVLVGFVVILREQILPVVLPLFFISYLIYGFIRPRISRKMRHEIEEEDEDDEQAGPARID
jgi:CDP-diacylglycerol--serine O-phosphatidyltransferase